MPKQNITLKMLPRPYSEEKFDSLWIKSTDALNSNLIGITNLHVSGSSSILLLVPNGSSQLHKMYQSRCTAQNSRWWAERLPETCRVVIPIKLEFSASVGFIHKESVTMHGHTVVKKSNIRSSNVTFSSLIWTTHLGQRTRPELCKLVSLTMSVEFYHRSLHDLFSLLRRCGLTRAMAS
jgi:hypothetical protein